MRLAYDELLANQLALAVIRQRLRRSAGRPLTSPGKLRQAILSKLPFKLTARKPACSREIDTDLASPYRMLRLLQGDVGSGKTVVALLAMATAVEAGAQAAFMAPTELLARQHLKTIESFATSGGSYALPSSAAARRALSGKRSLRRLPRAASTFSSAPMLCFRSRSNSAISRLW